MPTREEFHALWLEYQGACGPDANMAVLLSLQAEHDAARLAVAKQRARRKPPTEAALLPAYVERHFPPELADAVLDPFAARLDVWNAQARRSCDRYTQRLCDIAKVVPVHAGNRWLVLETVSGVAYGSQGLGARRYMVGRAEVGRLIPRAHGVESRLVEVPWESDRGALYPREIRVEVAVSDDVDVLLLRFKPSLSLREWLRACLKLGMNPRVFNPHLPFGIEARAGLDHFGNDLPGYTNGANDAPKAG